MRVYEYTCDRCGRRFHAKQPPVEIRGSCRYTGSPVPLDLCELCAAGFKDWMDMRRNRA